MAGKAFSAAKIEKLSSDFDQSEPQYVSETLRHLRRLGIDKSIPESCETSGFYSHFFASFMKVNQVKRGRISCTVSVLPPITNTFATMHGGSVGSLVELLSIACARTVVAEDRELFLGEVSISFVTAAPINSEVLVDASVVKSGRNVTMVAFEFKQKKTGNLLYVAHATFYNIPVAKL